MDSARDICPLAANGGALARHGERCDDVQSACLVTDGRGVIVDADARSADLLGMPESALAGKLLIAFVARQDTRTFREHLAGLARLAQATASFEVRMRARGKAPFRATVSVSAAPRQAPGGVLRFRWSVRPTASTTPVDPALAEVLRAVADVAAGAHVGRAGAARARVDISAVVGEALVEHAPAVDQRGLRLAVEGAAGAAAVLADEARLRQAVGALLGAAIAAAPFAGGVRVKLAHEAEHAVLECSFDAPDPARASFGSPLSLVLLATRLAADGARLEVAPPGGAPVLRARWLVAR